MNSIVDYIPKLWKLPLFISFVILGAAVLVKSLKWLIEKSFEHSQDKHPVDPTKYKFLKNAVALVVWVIALGLITYSVPQLRAVALTLFAGAGIFMAILGFAAQQAFSNIISGIFLVIFKPFRVGDLIKVGSQDYGFVEDITLRHVVINSFQNKRIIIPNSVISAETVINDSIKQTEVCRWIELGISYESDLNRAIKIIREVCENHPLCIDFRSEEDKAFGLEKVQVYVTEFADFSVNLKAYVWTMDSLLGARTKSAILIEIKKRFAEEGIEIPYPHRVVIQKNM